MAEKQLLIHNASQLLTLAGGRQKGSALGELGMIEDGAALVEGGRLSAVGKSAQLLKNFPEAERLDAEERVVMPGFVDPHTHAVWAGDRAAEFEMRVAGKSYLEIMQAGGGIRSTVRETRAASLEQLKEETRGRLWEMFRHGTTTAEVKTGYGLELESELRMLQAIVELNEEGPWDLAATFLGAHAVPPEYEGRTDDYTSEVCAEMLPEVKRWWGEHAGGRELPFVDVFCETGAFDLDQTRRILETAKELGFPLKVHADEFDNLGGTSLAVEMGAVSADHLVSISEADIEALGGGDTAAVGLPATPFGLAEGEYTPARKIVEAGGTLAIATDMNPGTAWCESMQMALALACRYMKLTPAEAIAAATINAAAAIGREDLVGSLEAGKQADLLILEVSDFRQLGYRFGTNLVHTVVKRGDTYPVKGE